MLRRLVIIAAVLLALLGISQLVIPPIVEHHIEGRLTAAGGNADVSVAAFPAVRLLFGDGSSINVDASGLDLTPQGTRSAVFSSLDDYDSVSVDIRDFRAGPFRLARFDLTRPGTSAQYHLVAGGSTSAADIASYGASRLGLPGGPLAGYLSNQLLPNDPIPIRLDMGLESQDGRIVVTSGTGSVAGVPTGPLAELITSLVAVRI